MSRGLGAQERKLLERARREGLTPVLPDDMDAFSSEASSIRRAARRLQDKGLIRLSLIDRNSARYPPTLIPPPTAENIRIDASGAAADGISKFRNITATSTAPNSTAITPDTVTAEMSFA